jgi:hypothetical protein
MMSEASNIDRVIYHDFSLGILFVIRLFSMFVYTTDVFSGEKLSYLVYFELLLMIFSVFAFEGLIKQIKASGFTKRRAFVPIFNQSLISFMSIAIISSLVIDAGSSMTQALFVLSLSILFIELFFPLLMRDWKYPVVAYAIIVVVFFMVQIKVVVIASIVYLPFTLMTSYVVIVIVAMVVALFIEMKRVGFKGTLLGGKKQVPYAFAYLLLAGGFVMFVIMPRATFPFLFEMLFFLVFIFILMFVHELNQKSPPFLVWWVGFLLFFMLLVI